MKRVRIAAITTSSTTTTKIKMFFNATAILCFATNVLLSISSFGQQSFDLVPRLVGLRSFLHGHWLGFVPLALTVEAQPDPVSLVSLSSPHPTIDARSP